MVSWTHEAVISFWGHIKFQGVLSLFFKVLKNISVWSYILSISLGTKKNKYFPFKMPVSHVELYCEICLRCLTEIFALHRQ